MSTPLQQVNLYRIDPAQQAADAGTRALVLVMVGTLVLVGLVALGGQFYLSHLSAQRDQVASQMQENQAQLAQLRAAMPDSRPDPFLHSELQRLEQNQRHLADSLNALRRHIGDGEQEFSAIFAGLARNTLDGIWFSDVAVSAGGAALTLRGQATEPALVPRLLQTLSSEPAFNGRSFRKVSFERRTTDTGSLIDFELRSADAEGIDDAG